MPLQVYPRQTAFRHNSLAQELLDYLVANDRSLRLDSAVLFCDYPLFREEDQLLSVHAVLVSPNHGVVLIHTSDSTSIPTILKGDYARLEGTFSHVFSRLVKYPKLRASRDRLAFPLDAVLYVAELVEGEPPPEDVIVGTHEFSSYINRSDCAVAQAVLDELISVLDGSKALLQAPARDVESYPPQSKVSQIRALEEEIRRFDREQRVGYMTEVYGTQRIRGLAGSGKTVVLAMKAALTAVKYPDATIAFVFYTKSLYQHVKQLITRFYRLYDDRDPDWDRVRVLHAWGGDSTLASILSRVTLSGSPRSISLQPAASILSTRLSSRADVS